VTMDQLIGVPVCSVTDTDADSRPERPVSSSTLLHTPFSTVNQTATRPLINSPYKSDGRSIAAGDEAGHPASAEQACCRALGWANG